MPSAVCTLEQPGLKATLKLFPHWWLSLSHADLFSLTSCVDQSREYCLCSVGCFIWMSYVHNLLTLYFSGLNWNSHSSDQRLNESESLWTLSASLATDIWVQIFVSSANIRIYQSGRSFTNNRNQNGAWTERWGTPLSIFTQQELDVWSTTCSILAVRKELNLWLLSYLRILSIVTCTRGTRVVQCFPCIPDI